MVEHDATLQQKMEGFGRDLFVQEKEGGCTLAWTRLPLPVFSLAHEMVVKFVEVVLNAAIVEYKPIDHVTKLRWKFKELL